MFSEWPYGDVKMPLNLYLKEFSVAELTRDQPESKNRGIYRDVRHTSVVLH